MRQSFISLEESHSPFYQMHLFYDGILGCGPLLVYKKYKGYTWFPPVELHLYTRCRVWKWVWMEIRGACKIDMNSNYPGVFHSFTTVFTADLCPWVSRPLGPHTLLLDLQNRHASSPLCNFTNIIALAHHVCLLSS